MSIRSRVAAVQRQLGQRDDGCIIVLVNGQTGSGVQERVEQARRRGMGVKFVQVSVGAKASSLAAAERIVEEHRRTRAGVPIQVTDERSGVVLLEWAPAPPEWIL